MRIRVLFLTVVVVAVAFGVQGGPASADAGPSFGDTLTSDTKLTCDLSGSGDGLIIGADGITIDLNGHTLSGDGTGSGIDNSGGHDNVTIKNGTIEDFAEGVLADGADGLSLKDLNVIGASGSAVDTGAIHVLDSEDVVIEDCSVSVTAANGGPHCIRLDTVTDVKVEHCDIDGGFIGVSFFSIGGNVGLGDPTTGSIKDCTISDCFSSCILLGNTDDATVEGNDMSGAASGMQIGFHANNATSGIEICDNDVHDNGGGLFVTFMTDSEIYDNDVSDNLGFGILLRAGTTDNEISENTVNGNGVRGIVLIFGANDNLITENTVRHNGSDGISLFLGANTGNEITENTARNNGGFDLFHNGASTPNTWEDNTFKTSFGADIS